MADDADRAAEATDLLASPTAAIAAARARLAGDGADTCADCGDPIPTARRLAFPAATRCIFCQSEHEGRR